MNKIMHHDCGFDCELCWEEKQRIEKQEEAEHYAQLERAQQRKLWGPGGIFYDKNDPLCQEILEGL